jgi:hypothetical protein
LAGSFWSAVDRSDWRRAAALRDETRPYAEAIAGAVLGHYLTAEAAHLLLGPDGDAEHGLRTATEAVQVWSTLGDPVGLFRAKNLEAQAHGDLGQFAEAARLNDEALALARRMGDLRGEAIILGNQAADAHIRARHGDGDYGTVIALHRASYDRLQRLGLPVVNPLCNLAQAEIEAGWMEQARRDAHVALELAWNARSPTEWIFCLIVFGQLAITEGDVDGGLAILGAVVASAGTPFLRQEVDDVLGVLGIESQTAQRGMRAGEELDLERLVADLLAEPYR